MLSIHSLHATLVLTFAALEELQAEDTAVTRDAVDTLLTTFALKSVVIPMCCKEGMAATLVAAVVEELTVLAYMFAALEEFQKDTAITRDAVDTLLTTLALKCVVIPAL
jgi:hypothetical protein